MHEEAVCLRRPDHLQIAQMAIDPSVSGLRQNQLAEHPRSLNQSTQETLKANSLLRGHNRGRGTAIAVLRLLFFTPFFLIRIQAAFRKRSCLLDLTHE